MSSFMVVGVDEVLYMAGAVTQKEAALAVHKILQAAAQKLEHKKI